MPTLLIRHVEESLKRRLRLRAAAHGRSMEAEARDILDCALTDEPVSRDLAQTIGARFAAINGCDLELPPREAMRALPDFTS